MKYSIYRNGKLYDKGPQPEGFDLPIAKQHARSLSNDHHGDVWQVQDERGEPHAEYITRIVPPSEPETDHFPSIAVYEAMTADQVKKGNLCHIFVSGFRYTHYDGRSEFPTTEARDHMYRLAQENPGNEVTVKYADDGQLFFLTKYLGGAADRQPSQRPAPSISCSACDGKTDQRLVALITNRQGRPYGLVVDVARGNNEIRVYRGNTAAELIAKISLIP